METNTKIKLPEHFIEYSESIMSNIDHVVDRNVEEALKDTPFWASYPGMGFYGRVWYQDSKWYCEVWCYGSHCQTFVADSPEELMDGVSLEYGYD